MTTGERIKAARKHVKMTQAALGLELGVSGSMIAQYETGKRNPKMETLEKIADALNTSVFDLMGVQESNGLVSVPISDDLASLLGLDGENGLVIGSIDPNSDAAQALTELYGDDLSEAQQEALRTISRIKGKLAGVSFRKLSDSEAQKAGFIQFRSDADRLTYFYSLLNDEGKRIAADRVQELSEVPKYGKHWGKEITDKITCPMSQIDEYTAKGYEVSSIQYFENGTGEGTATMVKVAPSDALQVSDTTAPENPPENAPDGAENK